MTARTVTAETLRRPRANGTSILKLGWLHFWLLATILGGMLGLVALVFFASFVSR